MMQRQWISIVFFVAMASPSSSQQDVLQDAKNWFTAPRRTVLERLFKDPTTGGDLSAEVKATLRGGDLRSLSPPIVGQVPSEIWTAMGAGPILTLPKEAIINLLLHGHITAPTLQKRLQDILLTNISQAHAIEMLATLREKTKEPSYREWLLLSKLGQPEQWKKDNIIAMKEIFNYLPMHFVARIVDTEALQTLSRQVILCLVNGNGTEAESSSCPANGNDYDKEFALSTLHSYLTVKLEGEPRTWQTYQFLRMNITAMSPTLLPLVNDATFLARKQDIINMLNNDGSKRELIGRAVVTKLLAAEKVKDMTDVDQVKTFLTSLGNYLGYLVYAEDLPAAALNNSVIMASTKYNTEQAIRAGKLEAKTATAVIQRLALLTNITAEDARKMGMPILSLAPAALLGQTVANMNPTLEELALLATCVDASSGPSAMGKLRVLATPLFKLASTGGQLNLSFVPPVMLGLAPSGAVNAIPAISAPALLQALPQDVDPTLVRMLISKLEINQKVILDMNFKALLSLNDLKVILENSGSDALQTLSLSMPATSVLGKMAVLQALGQNSTLNMDAVPQWLMPFLGAKEVSKIAQNDILGALAALKDAQPTVEACNALKHALVTYYAHTLLTMSEDEVFALLTPSDVEAMPPCVIAQFGTTRLQSMDPVMKVLLMRRVVALGSTLFTSTSIPQRAVKVILQEGLAALGAGASVTVADLQLLNLALVFAPPSVIRAVTADATFLALTMFNMMATTPLMPCLDHDTLRAVQSLMLKQIGPEPSQWSSVASYCCLLTTLSSQQLNSIPAGALATCSCDMKFQNVFSSVAQDVEAFCKTDLGGMFTPPEQAMAAVEEAQVQATLRLLDPTSSAQKRKKRATADISVCNRAAVSGADAIAATELESLPVATVVECLVNLGSRDMDDSKAAILALKVPQSVDPSWFRNLSAKNLSDMGFTLKGIQPRDIPGLPALTYPAFNDVIYQLGKPEMNFPTTQLSAYASKVLRTWKTPISSWTGLDIILVNRLLCAFNSSDIEKLSTDGLKQAMPTLGQSLAGCELNATIAPLALRAEAVYGPPTSWTKATVQEMGVIFAGVSPEKVMSVPAAALAGLTNSAANLITNDVAKVMTYQQIEKLPNAVLPGLSTAQKSIFGDALMRAKRDLLEQLRGNADTARLAVPLAAVLLGTALWRGRQLYW